MALDCHTETSLSKMYLYLKKKKKLELTRMTLKMCLKKEGKKRQLCGATICEFINRKEAMKPLNLKFHFSSEERLGVHVYICVV